MKKTAFALLITLVGTFAFGQEETSKKTREIAFVHSPGVQDLGLAFRLGNGKIMWRLQALGFTGQGNSQLDYQDFNFDNSASSFSGRIQTGIEFRKEIIENFQFRYGFDLNYSHLYNHMEYSNQFQTVDGTLNTYSPGINAVLGFNYCFMDRLVIGTEFLPGASYHFTKEVIRDTQGPGIDREVQGFSANLSISSILMSIAFRF